MDEKKKRWVLERKKKRWVLLGLALATAASPPPPACWNALHLVGSGAPRYTN